ncbi:MAG TPA: Ig-like domain-containing protein [Gryllotalpicola sp.]
MHHSAPPRRLLTGVVTLSLAIVGLLAGSAAVPAQAAPESHPTLTVSDPERRALSDLAQGAPAYTVTSDFKCDDPVPAGVTFTGSDKLNTMVAVIYSGTFDSAPVVQLGISKAVSAGNAPDGHDQVAWLQAALGGADGLSAGDQMLPGSKAWKASGVPAHNLDFGTLADGSYTLALVCMDAATGYWAPPGTGSMTMQMAWSTMTVSSGSWRLDGDPTPTATPTTTAIAETDTAKHALTATITSADGTTSPTGAVQFTEDGTNLGAPVALTAGSGGTATATLTPTAAQLSVGSHSFSASYAGVTDAFGASNANAAPVTVTITAPAAATFVMATAKLNADDHTAVDVTATVATTKGGEAADGADGTVQFFVDGAKAGDPTDVTDGAASGTLAGLKPGSHVVTAQFTPSDAAKADFNASAMSDPTDAVIVPTPLKDGDTELTPGTSYEVTEPAGTFTDGGTVHVQLHSDPVDLDDATAAGDGSLVYDFVLPADTPAGAHSLVFTDATDATKTATVAFTVTGEPSDDPSPDPSDDPGANNPGGSGGNGSGDPGAGDPGAGGSGSNDPVSFATGWVAHTVKTPAGLAGVFLLAFLAAAAGSGAWVLVWRRRTAAAAR